MGYLGAGLNALDLGDEAERIQFLDRRCAWHPGIPWSWVPGPRWRFAATARPTHSRTWTGPSSPIPSIRQTTISGMLALTRLGRKAEAEAEAVMDRIRAEQDKFAEIRRGLERNPLDLDLKRQAARWLMEHGHDDEAIDWANLVLHAVPSDPAMNRLLADHYRKEGKLGLANFHEAHASASPGPHSSSMP